jgi:hypothetical protein
MIRRFGAVLIGLALTLPLAVASVSAHTNGGLATTIVDSWSDASGTHVVGSVTNHTSTRQRNINVTATWTDGSQSALAFITSLAPHASTPFHILEPSAVTGSPTASATGESQGIAPVGRLSLTNGSVGTDSYTVTVQNESLALMEDVRVYALGTSAGNGDAAASAAADLAAGASASFTVNFDPDSDVTAVTLAVAQTTTGSYSTSWNNTFSDLGSSSFSAEIAWLADHGITLGCGGNNFCPGGFVTREQMASFLARALQLPAPTADHFTDDETSIHEADINSLAEATPPITQGCTATTFCPTARVTREQMAAFLDRAFDFPTAGTDYFTDDENSFAEVEINNLRGTGITLGCTATTYCPTANVTREQMAAFLFRAAQAGELVPPAP